MSNAVTVPADKLAELQRDAARYRWLRDRAYGVDWSRRDPAGWRMHYCRTDPTRMDLDIDHAIGVDRAFDALGVRVLDDTQRLDWLSGLPEEDASLARNPSGLWGVTVKRDGVDHLLGVGKTPREALDDAHGVDLPHGGNHG